jgi:hypothetical protein
MGRRKISTARWKHTSREGKRFTLKQYERARKDYGMVITLAPKDHELRSRAFELLKKIGEGKKGGLLGRLFGR